ncbi:MAG: peptide-methionine (S)-S-oxide reductase MsrA [Methylotenera sp.]|nr:peptide-methionine (S)-S-oxide reductase MsrA [Oligoflexia bacterium]
MTEKFTLGAGCFWGVEDSFRNLKGVVETAVGYSGGTTSNPRYSEVCTGNTGHAETVEVLFDPKVVSYEELLEKFWEIHDPRATHRSDHDSSYQYRSVIFFHTPDQERLAIRSRARQPTRQWTSVVPAVPFYRAEAHHQQYVAKRKARYEKAS